MDEAGRGVLSRTFGRRAVVRGGLLSGVGLAAAALIGCGGNEQAKPAATSAQGTQAAGTTAAQQVAGVDVGGKRIPYNFPEPAGKTPKPGGTLVVGVTWDVSTMDPTTSAAGGTITVPNTVYDRLLGYKRGPQADPFKLELVPELAQQWENTPDGLVYTFKLQPGVKWQNVAPLSGRAFKAADVKFAYERYASTGVQKPYFTNMKSVEAPDDATVKITLNAPQPDFLIPLGSRYTSIFPKELVDSGEIEKKVVGTGPMILKSATPGSTVEFTKNADHWRGSPYLDGLTYRIITDASAMLAAFRTNQLDFGYSVGGTARNLDTLLKTNPNVQANAARPVNNLTSICVNLLLPKYQDERVRRAISMAMDRDEIMKTVQEGYAVSLPTFPWFFLFDQ